jgi:hypothetical protein
MYRAGSLAAATRELARYKLYSLSVQDVRWAKGGTVKSKGLYFCVWVLKGKSTFGNRIFCNHRIVSAVKRVEFVSDRISFKVPRGCWCNIIVLKPRAPSDDSKTVFMGN